MPGNLRKAGHSCCHVPGLGVTYYPLASQCRRAGRAGTCTQLPCCVDVAVGGGHRRCGAPFLETPLVCLRTEEITTLKHACVAM